MALTARIPTEILSLLSIAVMVIGLPIIMFILMADQVSLSLSGPAVTEPAANIPDDRARRASSPRQAHNADKGHYVKL